MESGILFNVNTNMYKNKLKMFKSCFGDELEQSLSDKDCRNNLWSNSKQLFLQQLEFIHCIGELYIQNTT